MTKERLIEHKENMDKIMERLGGRRDDIWQDRYIYEIALAIHDLLVEKERKGASDDTDVLERVNKCDYIRFGKGVH